MNFKEISSDDFSLDVLICSISFIDVPNKNSLCALCVVQRIMFQLRQCLTHQGAYCKMKLWFNDAVLNHSRNSMYTFKIILQVTVYYNSSD